MIKLVRIIGFVFLGFIFSGCAHKPTMLNIPEFNKTTSKELVDLRPESEKQSKIFSLNMFNKAYGLRRQKDGHLSPNKLDIFKYRIYKAFPDAKNVKVHHFVIYDNSVDQMRREMAGDYSSVSGSRVNSYGFEGEGKLITSSEFDVSEEYLRAKVTLPDNRNVYVSYLKAEIDGVSRFVRVITPSTVNNNIYSDFIAKGQDSKVFASYDNYYYAVESAISFFLEAMNN